mmetsp:Transcript_49373/g.119739  ORF Transcript_49373/g.119739 Transcript_49373/m.119739 type:complete len:504 (-) Transcript_49373:2502-4013(-)
MAMTTLTTAAATDTATATGRHASMRASTEMAMTRKTKMGILTGHLARVVAVLVVSSTTVVDAFQCQQHPLSQSMNRHSGPLSPSPSSHSSTSPLIQRMSSSIDSEETAATSVPTSTSVSTYYMDSEMVDLSKYESLLEWLKTNGATINDKLVIRKSSLVDGDGDGVVDEDTNEDTNTNGYGVFVTQQVEEDELLFEIPRRVCLTLDQALTDTDCGRVFLQLIDKAGPGANTVVMAAYMAKEYLLKPESDNSDDASSSSSPSFWTPYFETLPWTRGTNNQEHILFWSDEMIETLLQGSLCYGEATTLRGEVDLAVQILGPLVGRSLWLRSKGLKATDDTSSGGPLLKWPWEMAIQRAEEKENSVAPPQFREAIQGAFCSLLTRSFQDNYEADNSNNGSEKSNDYDDDDEDESEKLVPLLDMLQHNEYPNIKHAMRKADGTVEVRARFTIDAGEELFNQYRSETEESMPYARFFTRFGFVPGITEEMIDLLKDKSSIFYPKKVEV